MTCSDKECLPPEELPFQFDIVKGNKKTDGAITNGAAVVVDNNSNGLLRPVKWDFDLKELGNDTYEMIWDATIEEGWNVYSQDNLIEGTRPTVFTFNENNDVRFLEETVREEGKLKDGFDSVFEMRVKKFANKLTFKRKVKLTDSNTAVTGNVEFITCDNGRCLPPEIIPFSFSKNKTIVGNNLTAADISAVDAAKANDIKGLVKDCDVDVTDAESDTKGKSILTIFLLGFLGGFAALLTPCVFPMIPMTVSFFTKQSKTQSEGIKNAIIYALSIIIIYVSLGYLVTMLFGAETMSELSTGIWFNLAFFVVFVVFAFSFLAIMKLRFQIGL